MGSMSVYICLVWLFGLLGLFSSSLSVMRVHFGGFCDGWALVGSYGFYSCLYMFGLVIWASGLVSVEFVCDEIAFRPVV